MSDIDLNVLDLNLLVALDALLEERSVTQAAERLGRSQPALSASLKRLRRQFGDELLVRAGNSFELSPLAVQLRRRVGLAMSELERVFATRADFDPRTADRRFTVIGSDYAVAVIGPVLGELVAARAPGVSLRFIPVTDRVVDNAEDMLRTVDGLFLPHGYLTGLPHLNLFDDRWIAIADAAHPSVSAASSLAELSAQPWVLAFSRQVALILPARRLQALGVDIRVEVAVESFTTIPHFVVGTQRLGFVQEQLLRRVADPSAYQVLPMPFDAPLKAALWWHPTLEQDPGHRWFRSVLAEAGRAVQDGR